MAKQQLSIREHLASDVFKNALAEVLPNHVTPDRMARVALIALRRVPKLAECTQESFFNCMMQLSSWGIEPDGRRAHLIPYGKECTLQLDYKGIVELVYRSGTVANIHADVVRRNDVFDYDAGEVLHHIPWYLRQDEDAPKVGGEIYAVYCTVKFKDDTRKSECMSVEDVEGIRKRSRAGKSGPWVTDWNEMAKKTVFKRLSKWLPLSAEARDAMHSDDERMVVEAVATKPVTTSQEFAKLLDDSEPAAGVPATDIPQGFAYERDSDNVTKP